MAENIRETISQAIAFLPSDSSADEVQQALDPLFDASTSDNPARGKADKGGVSPLMVACDKGNEACLEYLLEKQQKSTTADGSNLERIIGGPLDASNQDDKNTAIHHAAMVGCSKAIPILKLMNNMGDASMISSLGSVVNSHGDTPLMMAATSGHLDFLQTWYSQLLLATNDHENSFAKKEARQIFQSKNGSQDTCLTLACCHGHVALVDFFLSLGKSLSIGVDEVKKCQLSLHRMQHALQSNPALLEHHKDQLEAVQTCVEKLETELAQRAEATAQELLLQLEDAEGTARRINPHGTKASNKTKKKKSKRKSNNKHPTPPTKELSSSNINTPASRQMDGQDDPSKTNVRLMILQDGKLAVRVQGTTEPPLPELPILPATTPMPSTSEMFRQRAGAVARSSEVDAILDALCLDVSMLLYTPHGMALHLSPSQLDAIQGILERQLETVQEARAIQTRMHHVPEQQRPNPKDDLHSKKEHR